VATLDAIDASGEVYSQNDLPTPSDSLTSLPFDLSPWATGTDTVRLSFFYQAGGKGEIPERTDSLLLDFYSPATERWARMWFAITDTFSHFSQVVLSVPRNTASTGSVSGSAITSMSPDEVRGGKEH
jgi:hypothetical protein